MSRARQSRAFDAPEAAHVLSLMERVADWRLAHLEPVASIKVAREETREPRSWQQGAFYVGLTALAERGGERNGGILIRTSGAASHV